MTAITHRETNALAIAGQAMQLREFGGMLVSSGMLNSSIRTPEAAVTIMVKGLELGLPPMAALNGITVIQGKPTVSPQLMLSLINRSGQLENIEIQTGKDGATVTMKRRGRSPFTAQFGPAEAQAMGLNGKDNYKKQPAVMYQWRAVAACARVVFPDVIDGLYMPEELGADVSVNEDGEMTVTVQQEAKAAPAQAAPQTRHADVTREVAQAAGVQAQQPQGNPVNAEALKRVRDMAARVQKYGAARVEEILGTYDWQNDMTAAAAVYADLKQFGLDQAALEAAKAPQAQQGDVVEGQFTPDAPVSGPLTTDQIGKLQAAAKGAGADTSEKRAALWAWILQRPEPVGTTSLTSQDAVDILQYLVTCNPEQRAQALGEALGTFKVATGTDAAQGDADELPF